MTDEGFQCPEGLLLGRNFEDDGYYQTSFWSFSAPKGCCLVATLAPHRRRERGLVFQCPEGLLLGRNKVGRSQWKGFCEKFQCPEGLLLGRNRDQHHP